MGIGISARGGHRPARLHGSRLTKQSVVAGLVAGVIAVAAGGVAIASASSGGAPVLRGCASARTGALRLLTRPGQACTAGERAVSWSAGSVSWRGAWHSGSSYAAGDAVSYAGASYLATQASVGKYPTLSPRFWSVLAASGQPGPSGPPGASGAQGPPGTGDYAEFYNPWGSSQTINAGSNLPFGTAGPQHGGIVTPTGGNNWTINFAGTYEVSIDAAFTGPAVYILAQNLSALAGTEAGTPSTTGGDVSETVVITASAGDTLKVVNSGNNTETMLGGFVLGERLNATLLITKIS